MVEGDAPPSDAGKALSFHWRSVLMHAISRDTSSFPHPCIYCQVRKSDTPMVEGHVNGDAAGQAAAGGAEEEEEEEEPGMMPDEEITRDVRYVLDDPEVLGVLFQVFSECQMLHPDEELDGEGDFMFNEAEVSNGAVCMMDVTD